jgi:hypothetical protein
MYTRPQFTLPPAGWHPAMSADFRPRKPRGGLGLNVTAAPAALTSAATTAVSIYGALVATGSAAGPIGAAVGGAIALGVAIYNLVQGCGQTCVQASDIANQVAGLLQQNLDNYLAQPVRTQSMQQAALTTFNAAWAQLEQMCGSPSLGTAGQNCISQRAQTGCQWKTSPSGWTQGADGTWTYTGAGPAGSGSTCWNWWVGYHDPIANDPAVVPDSVLATPAAASGNSAGTTITGTTTPVNYTPLILAAAIVAGVLLLS